jgi:hypothetical protein
VVAIGVDASDKTAAEAKDPGMDFSADLFDAHEHAALVLYRDRDQTHGGPRL